MKKQVSKDVQERHPMTFRGTECLNCGHPLDISDRYCPQCSQENNTKKLTVVDFIEEFFSTIIAYDSRLFRTLTAMLFHPGKMTIEYLEGKRKTYTNPFRFLLSLSIIYFLLLSLTNNLELIDHKLADPAGVNWTPDKNSYYPGPDVNEKVDTDSIITSGNFSAIGLFSSEKDSLVLADPKSYFEAIEEPDFYNRFEIKTEYFLALIEHQRLFLFEEVTNSYNIPWTIENRMSFNLARSVNRINAAPGSFLDYLLGRLPFATFFFLPVFALFITLVYIRKRYTYTDNLIFSFHNQSLMFILLIISFLVDEIFGTSSAGIAFLIFALYLYKSMRTFYGDGRFKTILKFLLLNTIFIILSGAAALALLLGSAFTY